MSYLLSTLHWILPASFWGWVGTSSFVLIVGAIALSASGASKLVSNIADIASALFKPVADWLGNAVPIFATWCMDGTAIIWRNPEVLSTIAVIVLGLGCRYYVPQVLATKHAQTQLSQCISAHNKATGKKTKAAAPAKSTLQTLIEKGQALW